MPRQRLIGQTLKPAQENKNLGRHGVKKTLPILKRKVTVSVTNG
jgi:hypothetical protein